MKLAIVYSRANTGIDAPLVTVEAHLSGGLPKFNIVGLPEAAVQESKERVRSALLNTYFKFPSRRITINLAPADLPKEGGRFDLPIAIGILAASGQIPKDKLKDHEFTGELALSGELRPVHGVLPMAISTHQADRFLIVPEKNANEAAILQKSNVFSAQHLLEVCAYLRDEKVLPNCNLKCVPAKKGKSLDLADVKGQLHAKRALEVAAAGGHSLLLIGPPGTGKTMLASRLATILPPLTAEQAIQVSAIASVSSQGFDPEHWDELPFRSPHHSSSAVALVGGGRPPRPGEISLAHHGILFLDELPEFARSVLESLREPLEEGYVRISRAGFQMQFPAKFRLIAAMNPCPCGYAGSLQKNCRCTSEQVQRYLNKLSGPLLDRIDMQIEVASLSPDIVMNDNTVESESSASVKTRVINSHHYQLNRQQKSNAELSVSELATYCELKLDSQQLLNQIMKKFNFSARVYHRILKVARTVADLDGCEKILNTHISEALTFRCLDKIFSNFI